MGWEDGASVGVSELLGLLLDMMHIWKRGIVNDVMA